MRVPFQNTRVKKDEIQGGGYDGRKKFNNDSGDMVSNNYVA